MNKTIKVGDLIRNHPLGDVYEVIEYDSLRNLYYLRLPRDNFKYWCKASDLEDYEVFRKI